PDPLCQTRVADGRGAHVDAAPPGAEVEARADDGDCGCFLVRHAGTVHLRLMNEVQDIAPIRVVIADDDENYLEALRVLIDEQPELTVVGSAIDGDEAVQLVDALDPEAAVIDLHMPNV